ncbi:MAG: hypothetical protein HXX09_16515 [Bacteroidetes bacterium]|nr:hypothetical protein [Bacteroidota bacterium]
MKKILSMFILMTAVLSIASISSCRKERRGCTNPNSINYNSSATLDDGSCIAKVYGCTDPSASNYNSSANVSDGNCIYTTQITTWTSLPTFPCTTALIDVYIDDIYRGSLDSYYNSTPGCGAIGGVSYDVLPGNHKFFAKCNSGTFTWGPTYYNISGNCFTWELN